MGGLGRVAAHTVGAYSRAGHGTSSCLRAGAGGVCRAGVAVAVLLGAGRGSGPRPRCMWWMYVVRCPRLHISTHTQTAYSGGPGLVATEPAD